MKQYVLFTICSLLIGSATTSVAMHNVDSSVHADNPHALLYNSLMQQLVTFLAETATQNLSEEVHASISRYMQSVKAENDLLEEHDLAVIAQALLRRWDLIEAFIFDEIYKAPRPNTQTINSMVVGANNQCCNNLLTAASSSGSSGSTCDLSGIITALDLLEEALVTCCNSTNGNFMSTFTVIADITTTFTTCCAKLTTDFAGTWTMLAGLGGSTDTCGTFTPITSVPTILSAPGNYCLTQSFDVGDAVGLRITGTRVYVDFNNYVLTVDSGGVGVISNADQTTITNGMILGGQIGVQANNDIFVATNMTFSAQNPGNTSLSITGTGCRVNDCSFDTVSIGIAASNTTALTIHNCAMNNIAFQGIALTNALSFLIRNCAVSSAATASPSYNDILIDHSNNGFVQNCLLQSIGTGITITNNSNIVLSDCIINGATNAGFFLQDSTDIALIRCQGSGGTGSGISLGSSTQNLSGIAIHDCIFSSNTNSGLESAGVNFFFPSDSISLQNCIFSGNTLYGLHLLSTSSSVVNNCDFTANGTGCLIESCFGVGIYHNSAANNTVDGFSLITSGSCIHRYNEASNNTEYGFFADSLSTTCTYYNNLGFNNGGGTNNFMGINGITGNVVIPTTPLDISSTGSAQQLVYNVSAPM